jgi:hypothetical protein
VETTSFMQAKPGTLPPPDADPSESSQPIL